METREEEQFNLLYTVVGHTSIQNPKISILLTANGIKELASRVKDGESIRITLWEDVLDNCEKTNYHQKITIIKNIN